MWSGVACANVLWVVGESRYWRVLGQLEISCEETSNATAQASIRWTAVFANLIGRLEWDVTAVVIVEQHDVLLVSRSRPHLHKVQLQQRVWFGTIKSQTKSASSLLNPIVKMQWTLDSTSREMSVVRVDHEKCGPRKCSVVRWQYWPTVSVRAIMPRRSCRWWHSTRTETGPSSNRHQTSPHSTVSWGQDGSYAVCKAEVISVLAIQNVEMCLEGVESVPDA